MMKSVKAVVAAVAFAAAGFSGVAMAAPDVVAGYNQNGVLAARGTDHIVYVWHSAGKTYYRVNSTDYYFDDANQSIKNKIVASFGINAVTYAGVTYDAAKGSFTCSSQGTEIYWAPNNNNSSLNDGCALHQLVVNAGLAAN